MESSVVSQAIRGETYGYKSKKDALLIPLVPAKIPDASSEHIAPSQTSRKDMTPTT